MNIIPDFPTSCQSNTTICLDNKRFFHAPLYFENIDTFAQWAEDLYLSNYEYGCSWFDSIPRDEFVEIAIENAKSISKEEVEKIVEKQKGE